MLKHDFFLLQNNQLMLILDGNNDVVGDIERAIAGMEEERSNAASQFESNIAKIVSNKFL